jgi:anthranilate/para-aminobenzoate synthase component I
MSSNRVAEVLNAPPKTYPAILEGQWLDASAPAGLVAMNPASVFEGSGDALAELPRWISWHADRHPAGVAIGYFSYEAARFFETLPLTANTSLPDLSFAYYPRVERLPRLEPEPAGAELSSPPEMRSNFDEHAYAEAVETVRNYIAAGDIYQANLTCRFRAQFAGIPPERIYSLLARMDFNVAIRTMTIEDDVATFHGGGGIVYDSRPEPEQKEMMLKARPLLEALGAPVASGPGILQACAVER